MSSLVSGLQEKRTIEGFAAYAVNGIESTLMNIRSLLFTPSTHLERLDKGLNSGADYIALDLEDGVGQNNKATARLALTEFVRTGLTDYRDRIAVRINSLSTPDGVRDLAMMLDWEQWPSLIIVPKVESSIEIQQVRRMAVALQQECNLLVTLETAIGIGQALAIMQNAPEGCVLGYGSADHMAETGGTMQLNSLSYGRAQVLNAAASRGFPALDGVWLDYQDDDGLRVEAEAVKAMGFTGKIAIHPAQIETINRVFSPTEQEHADALAMLEASRQAGGGAFSFRGKMVDAPVLARAHRIAGKSDSPH